VASTARLRTVCSCLAASPARFAARQTALTGAGRSSDRVCWRHAGHTLVPCQRSASAGRSCAISDRKSRACQLRMLLVLHACRAPAQWSLSVRFANCWCGLGVPRRRVYKHLTRHTGFLARLHWQRNSPCESQPASHAHRQHLVYFSMPVTPQAASSARSTPTPYASCGSDGFCHQPFK